MGQVVRAGAMCTAGLGFLGASYFYLQRQLAAKEIQTHKLDFRENFSGDLSKYAFTVYPPYGIANTNGDLEVLPGAPLAHISNKKAEKVLSPSSVDLEPLMTYFHTCLKTATLLHSQNFCWNEFKRMRDEWEAEERATGNVGVAGKHHPSAEKKEKARTFGETLINAFDLNRFLWLDDSPRNTVKNSNTPQVRSKEDEKKIDYLAHAVTIAWGHGMRCRISFNMGLQQIRLL